MMGSGAVRVVGKRFVQRRMKYVMTTVVKCIVSASLP